MRTTSLAVLVNVTGLDLDTLDPAQLVVDLGRLLSDGGNRRGWRVRTDAKHGVITLIPPEKGYPDAR